MSRTCLVFLYLVHLQRIDQEVYHMVVAQLQQHVVAKNSKTSLETSSADGKTLVPVSEMGRITCDMEFRFMLHRHWSLYEVSVLFASGESSLYSLVCAVGKLYGKARFHQHPLLPCHS